MNLTIDRTDFIKVLEKASKATSKKQSPILGNVCLSANKESIYVKAFDLSTSIFVSAKANIMMPGEACFLPETVLKFLNKCDDSLVKLDTEDNKMTVICGRAKVSVALVALTDYPDVEKLSIETCSNIELNDGIFTDMMREVSFAADSQSPRYELRCVNLKIENNTVTAQACDGYRMAIHTVAGTHIGKSVKADFNIFKDSVATILSTLNTEEISITYDKNNIQFTDSFGTTVKTSLCANSYPDVSKNLKGIKKNHTQKITINGAELYEMLKRVSVLPKLTAEPIKMVFDDSGAKAVYKSGATDFFEELDCVLEGEPFTIGFSDKYLSDGLKSATGNVELYCGGSSNGVTFEINGTEHMIMPMRLK